MFDVIIKNGTIIDGTRTPGYRGDLGIQGDRIKEIGDLSNSPANEVFDATDLVVAPGFVDVHNHSDGWLLKTPHITSKTTQGFTTEVIMSDGISYAPVTKENASEWIYYLRALNTLRQEEYSGWETLEDYLSTLDGRIAQNVATQIPYANLRVKACGFGRAVPDDYQMKLIIAEVEEAMDMGAVGLSTGLDYITQCFSTTDELVEACRPMAAKQGLYVTHMRYKKGTIAGLKEAVEIGKRAGVPVHISHLKGRDEREVQEVLNFINTVAMEEVDFSFDVYPYLPGSTMLNFLLPYEVWEDGPLGVIQRLHDRSIRRKFRDFLNQLSLESTHIAWVAGKENSHHQGKNLATYIEEVGLAPEDALSNLLIEENLAVLLVLHGGDDKLVHPFLQHEKYMMGSDGIFHEDGAIHPRQYGSATRVLGPCVRDHNLFSLEEAVYKLSAYPAKRFGLKDRGTLEVGRFADVVVFDSKTVSDKATYRQPHQYSVGINDVIVNGVPIISDGKAIQTPAEELPGRVLRFNDTSLNAH